MEDWIDRLAAALGEDPLSESETTRLLGVSREVAHRVERKITPLAAFLYKASGLLPRPEEKKMNAPSCDHIGDELWPVAFSRVNVPRSRSTTHTSPPSGS